MNLDSEKKLLGENFKWALGDFLAIEKHLVEQATSNSINNSWCVKKHFTHMTEHALGEAVEHSFTFDKQLSSRISEFRNSVKNIENSVDLEKIRKLRNSFRVLTEDETLISKTCPICELDIFGAEGKSKLTLNTKSNIDKSYIDNPSKKTGDRMVDTKAYGLIAAAQVGGLAVGEIAKFIDSGMKAEAKPALERPSTFVDFLLGGVGLSLASLLLKDVSADTRNMMAIVGSQRLVIKGASLLTELMPKLGGTATRVISVGAISNSGSGDGGLIQVDV